MVGRLGSWAVLVDCMVFFFMVLLFVGRAVKLLLMNVWCFLMGLSLVGWAVRLFFNECMVLFDGVVVGRLGW